MKASVGRSVRALLACAIALLAGGILVRQQAACEGCQPGNFTYDNPVGCDASCHVIYSGKLTGTCNSSCEASILQGRCVGTKGSCTFHRDWVDKSCGAPPEPPPAPSNTAAPIPTNTNTAQPPPAPTGTAEVTSTPAPTSTALLPPTSTPAATDTVLPSPTSLPPSTDTALPIPSSTPPPTDSPLPSPTPTDTPQPAPTSTNTPVPTPTPRPPELTSEVSCSVPGDGGWCRGGATLHLQASDPQGLGVVIHGDLNGNPFQCGPTCVLDLPEGQGTASFEAVSDSGKTASGSASWKQDSTPPELAAQLEGGTAGKNGWYTSGPVDLECTASDAISGVASVEYRLDGGAWGSAASAAADGTHALECRARDNAGNISQAGDQVSIDSGSPTTHIVLADGAWLAGHTTVRGSTKDAVSGLADVQVALDGGFSWISLGKEAIGYTAGIRGRYPTAGTPSPPGARTTLAIWKARRWSTCGSTTRRRSYPWLHPGVWVREVSSRPRIPEAGSVACASSSQGTGFRRACWPSAHLPRRSHGMESTGAGRTSGAGLILRA